MSSPFTLSTLPFATALRRWDIFCEVIDNFGDIGVCWRLARQLADEYAFSVRLWVDDLNAFRQLNPDVRVDWAVQTTGDVEIRRWKRGVDDTEVLAESWGTPGDVVVEAFACRLPHAFETLMARRHPKPVWINLDYLSAESWVADYHGLPSPHPHLPLIKHFFFPGFSHATGGLLRERALETQRQAFVAGTQRTDFLVRLGIPRSRLEDDTDTVLVSLFSYENKALGRLLQAWSCGPLRVICLAPPGRHIKDLEDFAERPLAAGDIVRKGSLELRLIPFLLQPDYDHLLWACDLNFVRGEDSFVRAQWAARPFIWHIYPQQDSAHHAKLNAFLDLYLAETEPILSISLRNAMQAWNGIKSISEFDWENLTTILPRWRQSAVNWQNGLMNQADLCTKLVQFCQSRL